MSAIKLPEAAMSAIASVGRMSAIKLPGAAMSAIAGVIA
jgi:hypothetical protein